MKVNVDKTIVASIALHVLVLGWGLITFSARSVEVPPEESLPVDIISADQLSKITHGIKSGEKDKPKPKVEKVAEAQPVDDAVGKITEKKEIITESAPPKPQEPVEKPVDKKPDPPKAKPPKPVVENKPKEPSKPQDKKPDPAKEDPMAEFMKEQEAKKPETKKPEAKKPEAKPTPKQETKAAQAQPPKTKQEPPTDYVGLANRALLTKQAPQRQALTGAVENASASYGTAHGNETTLSASEMGALIARLSELWIVPNAGSPDRRKEMTVVIRFQLTRDRRLAGPPVVVSRGNSQLAQVCAEAAVRAVLQGAPYNMLRDATYDKWSDISVTFDPDLMFRS